MAVVSAPALAAALGDIVGTEHLLSEPPALAAHAVDGRQPRWIVRPGSFQDVSRVLALAHAEDLAVAPRGSGSSLGLGNPPRRLDLVLDLSRLGAITEYVPEDMVASVEAGVSLSALARRVGAHGQMLALDPIGGQGRSIGGVLATGANGPLRYRYGAGRDLLLGVRFVQADGTITWGGAKVVKSVTGYDVPKLLVGSLGTLGVIAGATLRLHPVPSARGSWLCAQRSLASAGSFLSALLDSSIEPDRVVLLNGRAALALGQAGEVPAVLVSIGSVEEAVRSQGEALTRLAAPHSARIERISEDSWDRLAAALAEPLSLSLSGEPKRLAYWTGELEQRAHRLGVTASVVAEAGSGVLQCGLGGDIAGAVSAAELVQPLRDALASEGGSLVVERAPHEIKGALDVWGPVDRQSLALMERIKLEFDGRGILNPGRFVGGL
jgi:glycolate oxidase FAD binding subunit